MLFSLKNKKIIKLKCLPVFHHNAIFIFHYSWDHCAISDILENRLNRCYRAYVALQTTLLSHEASQCNRDPNFYSAMYRCLDFILLHCNGRQVSRDSRKTSHRKEIQLDLLFSS